MRASDATIPPTCTCSLSAAAIAQTVRTPRRLYAGLRGAGALKGEVKRKPCDAPAVATKSTTTRRYALPQRIGCCRSTRRHWRRAVVRPRLRSSEVPPVRSQENTAASKATRKPRISSFAEGSSAAFTGRKSRWGRVGMDTALSWFRTAQCDFFLYHVHVSTRQCGDAGTEMGLIPSHLHVFVAGAFQLIAWCIVIFFGLSAATLIGKSNQERDRALQQAKDAEQYVDALQVAMREERAEHEKELATMLVEIQRLQALLTSPPPLLDHDDEDKCISCYDAPRTTRFSECGHSQTCEICLDRLFAQRRHTLCPLRAPPAREAVLRGAHIAFEPAYMRQPA